MGNKFETSFIPEAIEKTPFADVPAQKFFAKWCEINDSIVPQFISREEWSQRGVQGILEKNDEGKQTLFLPEDLHLWEMMDVIRTVDHDTLARKPKKRGERADKIKQLGNTFEKAGIYLHEYGTIFGEKDKTAKEIAEVIAREFYTYGLSLQNKEQRNDDIPKESLLALEDKAQLDEWFLGKELYQKRLAGLGENPTEEQKEEVRKRLLFLYFKALAREGHKAEGEKPWETNVGFMQRFQDNAKKQITKAIETPEREMKTAIFRRGLEKLVTEMREVGWRKAVNDFLKKSGLDPILEQRSLHERLHIDELKAELAIVKQTRDVAKISNKELEIAKKIQKAVSNFPYKVDGNNPSEMIKNQFINCVGSSILGGSLLDEVGIEYFHVDLPEHSTTVLVTSDGKIYWQDFTPGNVDENYTEITANMLEENASVENINLPINNSGVSLAFKEFNPYFHIKGKLRVNIFKPEVGLQGHVLVNTGTSLSKLGRKEEAIEAYKQAININPENPVYYNGLGNMLSDLGRKEEAIEAYKQAINIDPRYIHSYNGLGNVLGELGRNEEAVEAYKQAIDIDPEYISPYNGLGNRLSELGKIEDAIEVYKKAISIDPRNANPYNGLGNALSMLGRMEDAIEAYKQAININPREVIYYNGLGNALMELGRMEGAVEVYKQAININPKDIIYYNGLAIALRSLGKYEEAIEAHKQALNINPEDAIPYNGLGNVLKELGRNEEAIEAFEKFISLWKGDIYWIKRAEEEIEDLKKHE